MDDLISRVERSGYWHGFLAGVCTGLFLFVGFLMATSCKLPTEPIDGCRNEVEFCDGRSVIPLSQTEVKYWEDKANEFATKTYGAGKSANPYVDWHPCFFQVGSTCAAGYTESKNKIHVSTAEPLRTGPLVAHETLHAIYWARFGNPDAYHKRPYGW